jgi:hypothetical protein
MTRFPIRKISFRAGILLLKSRRISVLTRGIYEIKISLKVSSLPSHGRIDESCMLVVIRSGGQIPLSDFLCIFVDA